MAQFTVIVLILTAAGVAAGCARAAWRLFRRALPGGGWRGKR